MAKPHIVLFADRDCANVHTHIFEAMPRLSGFNDVTSSFVILEGQWAFFADDNFASQMGPGGGRILGPGVYNWIEDALGPQTNDRLSSLKPV